MAVHRVVVLALPGVYPFELGIPGRVFGAARGSDGERLYEVATCSLDGGPVGTAEDFELVVAHGAEALAAADTVVIAPFQWDPEDRAADSVLEPLAAALLTIRPGTRVVSLCTAAVPLAAIGFLDGRPATTHWQEAQRCQELFPAVKWDADVLFVDDGDLLTSAGVAAGVDLCLHVVRQDHGSAVANGAARYCVVPPWREGGQAQFIERPVPAEGAAATAAARAWAMSRLEQPIALAELAGHARMSVRTFSRRFRQEVGMTPVDWLIRQRVDLARHLLEATDLPIDQIAGRTGFGTAASLRQHMRTAIGVSPNAYRRTFRADMGR